MRMQLSCMRMTCSSTAKPWGWTLKTWTLTRNWLSSKMDCKQFLTSTNCWTISRMTSEPDVTPSRRDRFSQYHCFCLMLTCQFWMVCRFSWKSKRNLNKLRRKLHRWSRMGMRHLLLNYTWYVLLLPIYLNRTTGRCRCSVNQKRQQKSSWQSRYKFKSLSNCLNSSKWSDDGT